MVGRFISPAKVKDHLAHQDAKAVLAIRKKMDAPGPRLIPTEQAARELGAYERSIGYELRQNPYPIGTSLSRQWSKGWRDKDISSQG
jgi:hypothetical protein